MKILIIMSLIIHAGIFTKNVHADAINPDNETVTSSNYKCKKIYESKLDKIAKHKKLNKVLIVAAGVGLSVAIGGAVAVFTTANLLGIIIIGGTPGVLNGFILDSELLDRQQKIIMSHNAQTQMMVPYTEIVRELETNRQALLQRTLDTYDAQVTHQTFADKVVREVNETRLQANLPALSFSAAITHKRSEISNAIMNQEIKIENDVSASLKIANKMTGKNISYEAWRLHMLNNDDAFCPQMKAITLKKATHNLVAKLNTEM